jgi:hypothetical protein
MAKDLCNFMSEWTLSVDGLQSVQPTAELLKDYRELRAVFMRARLFKSSKPYYTIKCLVNAALLAASITIICLTQSLPGVLLSAFILGVCWQQCGWLSHDFLHHQVLLSLTRICVCVCLLCFCDAKHIDCTVGPFIHNSWVLTQNVPTLTPFFLHGCIII